MGSSAGDGEHGTTTPAWPSGDTDRKAVRVLYVGGMPRSGSTLTDLMLDCLPGHVAVGELFYLWRNGVLHDGRCACGSAFHACPFWTEVGENAFGGWNVEFAKRVLELQHSVDRTAALPGVLVRRPAPTARDLDLYASVLQRLYDAIAQVSGADVVVDSSKRGSLAYVLRAMPGVQLTVAHVVRDPRGVAYSFSKVVALAPGSDFTNEMPRTRTLRVARRWLTVNALVASLKMVGVPYVRVRYEDLIADPQGQLGRIARAEGRPLTGALQALTPEGLRIPSTHAVVGGRIRLADGVLPLALDDAWRTQMDPRARRLIDVLTAPGRLLYGYR